MKYILILFIFFGCNGFLFAQSVNKKSVVSMLSNHNTDNDGDLLFNGYYNNLTLFVKDSLKLALNKGKSLECIFPIFFFKNGIVGVSGSTYYNEELDKTLLSPEILSKRRIDWGAFMVNDNTITALVFKEYSYGKIKLTKYMGTIKDSATIINWRAVKPYPPVPDVDIDPVELKFVPFSKKAMVDSTKIWINTLK